MSDTRAIAGLAFLVLSHLGESRIYPYAKNLDYLGFCMYILWVGFQWALLIQWATNEEEKN